MTELMGGLRGDELDILDLVRERPDPSLDFRKPVCPFCASDKVSQGGTTTTLVGFTGEDMNHKWLSCRCLDCKKGFTYECAGSKCVWVTSKGIVLKGVPQCFEVYQYTCPKDGCGGKVNRSHQGLDGKPTRGLACTTDRGDLYRIRFDCDTCDHGGFAKRGYYGARELAGPSAPSEKPLKIKFTVTEKPGIGFINPALLSAEVKVAKDDDEDESGSPKR